MIARAFAETYFAPRGVALATARGGNVIGGGDYAEDRIVPDIVRAWARGDRPLLRMPEATRPWQHALDCLAGYLLYVESADAPTSRARSISAPIPAIRSRVAELTRAMLEALGAPPEFDVAPIPDALEMRSLAVDASPRAARRSAGATACRARRRFAGPPTGTVACGSAKARAPSRSTRSKPMARSTPAQLRETPMTDASALPAAAFAARR